MRQLDLQRKEQERLREAELSSQSDKGKAVLKKLESNAKRAKEQAETPEADKKPKAWAVSSNFFTNQEEKKKAEEAAIAAKEAKRQKVLQELEERKVKAEKAAQAASAGEAQQAAAKAAREQAQRLAQEALA